MPLKAHTVMYLIVMYWQRSWRGSGALGPAVQGKGYMVTLLCKFKMFVGFLCVCVCVCVCMCDPDKLLFRSSLTF